MLDKDSILGALNIAISELNKFKTESNAKNDLLEKLITAIKIGSFDTKIEESKSEESSLAA